MFHRRVAPVKKSFGDALRVAMGGEGIWTAWIVDLQNGKAIAGNEHEPVRW